MARSLREVDETERIGVGPVAHSAGTEGSLARKESRYVGRGFEHDPTIQIDHNAATVRETEAERLVEFSPAIPVISRDNKGWIFMPVHTSRDAGYEPELRGGSSFVGSPQFPGETNDRAVYSPWLTRARMMLSWHGRVGKSVPGRDNLHRLSWQQPHADERPEIRRPPCPIFKRTPKWAHGAPTGDRTRKKFPRLNPRLNRNFNLGPSRADLEFDCS